MKPLLLLVVKAAISASLLYLAFRGVNLDVVGERLNRINPGWFATVILILVGQIFLIALRWRIVARECGISISPRTAWRLNLIAAFFNQTLPSSVGGDAARIWFMAHRSNWKDATYSVLIDRVAGVTALAVLVVICLPWGFELIRNPAGRATLMLIGFGSIAAFVVFLALGWVRRSWLERWWLTAHLASAAVITRALFSSARTGSVVAALSITIHLLTVAAAWSAARAAEVPFDPMHALLLMPPVILVATIPISIAGWGVRESAMMTAFGYAGLAQTDGLIVSVLYGAAMFLTGVLGGIVWILNRTERPS
jgi:uncharacterized protein (TIRG00374 family)